MIKPRTNLSILPILIFFCNRPQIIPQITPQILQILLFFCNHPQITPRPSSLAYRIPFYGNTNIAFSPYGDYWRQLKKICSLQLLSAKKVKSFGTIRQQEFRNFMKSGESIDVHEKVTEMVNNVVCVSSFGDNCRQRKELLEIIHRFGRELSGLYLADLFPDYEFLSVILGRKSKLLKMRKNFYEILDEILDERRRRGGTGDGDGDAHDDDDLLEVLLRIKEEDELGLGITNDNIKAIFAVEMMKNGRRSMMKKGRIYEGGDEELRFGIYLLGGLECGRF